ncbi:hypothetical protein F0919_08980 [Taibaiella lutea]|uniref:DUF4251 domain-containing protein n=1 Tax=Taibaiella lutea TaxID=2608001 RepID=A0A5M6CN72_9BACT|nr:hypothetical protein [Taibaiella lutea]KAA5534735.1 hypothetical protein F0919_08980 [Taibaiella lutea]
MKKFTYLAFATLSILAIVSCKKTVIDMNANNSNNSSGSSAGNNSNGSNNNTSKFDWTGTAPFSAKVDGTLFVIDPESFMPYGNNFGQINVGYWDINTSTHLSLWFNSSATAGNIYSCTVQYQLPNVSIHGPGKVKIITNNSTEVEGYFYGTPSNSDTTFNITEGYFKVPKS